MKKFLLISLLLLIALPALAIPQKIYLQGILKDANDNKLDGTYSIVFKIYSTATGGTALWQETHSNVTVTDGLYTVALGSNSSFPTGLFSNDNLYVGIQVGSDPEMSPRIQMLSVPFAFNADTLDGYQASDFIGAGGMTTAAADARYVNIVGDEMTGTLTNSANVKANQFISTVGTGTSPLVVSSQTLCTNLNADKLDGFDANDFAGGMSTAAADARYVNIVGDTMTGTLTMGANIIPNANDTYDLGSMFIEWNNVYAANFYGTFNGIGTGLFLPGYVKLSPPSVQSTTSAYAIWVKNSDNNGIAISAEASGFNAGSFAGYFKIGENANCWGSAVRGVLGQNCYGSAISGIAESSWGSNTGGYFESGGQPGMAVQGYNWNTGVVGFGGHFKSEAGTGVYGTIASDQGQAVWGQTDLAATSAYAGLFEAWNTSVGLRARNVTNNNYADLGTSSYAGFFNGIVNITGVCTASAFYGNGSNLTGLPTGMSTADADARYVNVIGDKMTGTLSVSATSIGVSGEATGINGKGIIGYAAGTNGIGVYGEGTFGGVYGRDINGGEGYLGYGIIGAYGSSSGDGIRGISSGNNSAGVHGINTNIAAPAYGGNFETSSQTDDGIAVRGYAGYAGALIRNYGGFFLAKGGEGRGVFGKADHGTDTNYGGYFVTGSTSGYGLYSTSEGSGYAAYLATPTWAGHFLGPVNIEGSCTATTYYGNGSNLTGIAGGGISTTDADARYVNVTGDTMINTLTIEAIYLGLSAEATASNGIAVYGVASGTPSSGVMGVYLPNNSYGKLGAFHGAQYYGVYGNSSYYAVGADGGIGGGWFKASTGGGARAVKGEATSTGGINYGGDFVVKSPIGYGLVTTNEGSGKGVQLATPTHAGYFVGNVMVTGSLEATDALITGDLNVGGNKNFLIDHPLDPANKILKHAAMEGPERKNIYNGSVILDKTGEVVVKLPSYFEALNKDFQYQLTTVGGYAPVYIKEEIKDNKFKIAGGKPGMKVCWLVIGIRNDAYAKDHPYIVEENKKKKGEYLYPEGFK